MYNVDGTVLMRLAHAFGVLWRRSCRAMQSDDMSDKGESR